MLNAAVTLKNITNNEYTRFIIPLVEKTIIISYAFYLFDH